MKFVDAEFAFDNSKVVFYFTAENRVDFRDLVKELASAFHMRIELRQIGIRDECKMKGGLGPCGRVCCCNAHLNDFERVSIKWQRRRGFLSTRQNFRAVRQADVLSQIRGRLLQPHGKVHA